MAGKMDAVIPGLHNGAQAADVTSSDLEGNLRMVENATAEAHAVGRGSAWTADASVAQQWAAEARRLNQMCAEMGVGVREAAALDTAADEMGSQAIRQSMTT